LFHTATLTISNNIIDGGISLCPKIPDRVDVTILNNTITGGNIGVYISPTSAYNPLLGSCYTTAYIFGNVISNCSMAGIEVGGVGPSQGGYVEYNTAIIVGNTITNTDCGINATVREEIRNNVIAYNEIGISYGSVIEGNLIIGNTYGIKGGREIRNNTIVNNSVGIESEFTTTLVYNNIYNNSEYNFRFLSPNDVNANYNWWGTADIQAINLTIHDFKYDFYLGKVDFVPFLTEPNSEAASTSNPVIPEFTSWIILPLLLTATLLIIRFKLKLPKTPSQQSYLWSNRGSLLKTVFFLKNQAQPSIGFLLESIIFADSR
jgi:hypothetical protein